MVFADEDERCSFIAIFDGLLNLAAEGFVDPAVGDVRTENEVV